ncbi:class I SAM-dependent methyltransferase [Streptomyces sp. NPDC059165]|uniref:class I SAM-dependent methyltransferase n=1 Tax=Streptomyces sp. NPDC059165 TaxID=3346751 RepID=UPI0036B49689
MPQENAEALTRQKLHTYMRGYTHSSLLRCSVELGVYDAVVVGPAGADVLATRLGTPLRGTRILLNALVAIGLLHHEDGRYSLVPGADDLLVSTGKDYFGGPIRLGTDSWEWDAHKRLAESVRKGGPVMEATADTPDFTYFETWAEHSADSTFNTGAAPLVADLLLPWNPSAAAVEVLDVGCGSGSYGFEIARRDPRVRLCAFDWSSRVLAVAEDNARRLGIRGRTEFRQGDAFNDPLGGPYDLVTMAHVQHHRSAEQASALLRRLHAAIRPGGRIGVVGHTYDEKVSPADDPNPHMFAVIMLMQTETGEPHSVDTYRRMFTEAGFTNVRFHASNNSMHKAIVADRV